MTNLLEERDVPSNIRDAEPRPGLNGFAEVFGPAELAEFDRRGFAVLPSVFEHEAASLQQGFEEAMRSTEWAVVDCENHDASRTRCENYPRMAVHSILERSHRLRWLEHDPRIASIATAVLGSGARFQGSDGNFFNGDTLWHEDGFWTFGSGRHLRFMLYLDRLDASSGALRVVVGSHHEGPLRDALEGGATPSSRLDLSQPDAGGVRALEVAPGDLVVLDLRVFHASFGGRVGRRLVSVDFGPPESRLDEAKRLFLQNATRRPSPHEYQALGRSPQLW
jgi:ectoine hydroxylase-related dioxygenase (phytanoyl-CoA dioxygenase family)